jgi:hypothetical protein
MIENKEKGNVKHSNSKSNQRTQNWNSEERKPRASLPSRQLSILAELDGRSYSRHCLLEIRFGTKLFHLFVRQDDVWNYHVSSDCEPLTATSYRPIRESPGFHEVLRDSKKFLMIMLLAVKAGWVIPCPNAFDLIVTDQANKYVIVCPKELTGYLFLEMLSCVIIMFTSEMRGSWIIVLGDPLATWDRARAERAIVMDW